MTVSRQRIDIFAGVFAALANATRLEIVQLLCESERTPSELAEALGVSRPNLSQQLAILQRAGVVRRRREGVHVVYGIVDPRLKEACTLIEDIVSRELSDRAHALGPDRPLTSRQDSPHQNGEP
jgi:DNA-binding transcriptional ArsR family regulator